MGLPPIATFVIALAVSVSGRELSSSSQQQQTPVDFDCPEEFGYYAHPTDCTQYYVCVFGGALLESCTGGLMYSHELQTCDWPRNVGCAPGQQQALQQQEISQDSRQQLRQDARQQELRQELARHELRQQEARQELRQQEARQELRQQEARQELRQQEARQELRQQEARQELRQQEARQDYRQDPRHEIRPEYRQVQEALRQPKQQQQQILQQVVDNRARQRTQITVPKADLYNTEEEELGPAIEELEIDRQQRVYRGQPSTLGQVASDRDGLTHSNAIPVPATGGRDKLSVISYGAQQQYNSLNKRKRTDGIIDSDHNFLTNSPRVRMKRDSDSSYQQSLGRHSFQRRSEKHNRRRRDQPASLNKDSDKSIKMTKVATENIVTSNTNNTVNDTVTSGTSNTQDHKEINSDNNNKNVKEEEVEEQEEEEEEEGEGEEEEEEEEGEEEEEEEEELDNAEEEQSEEDNDEDMNSKDSLEKPASVMESNNSMSFTKFKLDFPSPPSSWESFEDFKSSFDDIDFDVEKFLEDLKTDRFDDDIFGNNRKKKQQEENTAEARSAMKPTTVPMIIIPPNLNATQVMFELYFPKPLTNNISGTNESSFPLSSTVATPLYDSDYIERTLALPAPSTTFTSHQQITPSPGFNKHQGSLKYTLEKPDEEVTNNYMNVQIVSNRRSSDYEMPHPRSRTRSQGPIRRTMWRVKTTSGERRPARGPNRGNARYTLKSPRYFVMNTTPNYNGETKTHHESLNSKPVYEVKNSQQEIVPRFTGQNIKPTSFTGNQEYRYSYATHYNSAFPRPKQNNNNDTQSYEVTTPRQTLEPVRIDNTRHSDQGHQTAYDIYEQTPDYRRRKQNVHRRQNRRYKYHRPGDKSANHVISPQSTIQPIVVGNYNFYENKNNSPAYEGKFNSETTVNHNEGSEYKPDVLSISRPTIIPTNEIQTTQQIFSWKQPVPTPFFKTGTSQLREDTYYPKTDIDESPSTESTFMYDELLKTNNNENRLARNHSRHVTSQLPYNTKTKIKIDKSSAHISSPLNTESSYPSFKYSSKSNRDEYNQIQDSTTNEKQNAGIKIVSTPMFEKLNATVAYPDETENHQPVKMKGQFNPTKSYQLNIQQEYPHIHSASDSSSETLENNRGQTNNSSTAAKKPSSYFYVNQKIGPIKKIAIFNNIPSVSTSDDEYDYYNDYDEEDYEDVSNETKPIPPKVPKTLQNIDYQDFEDPEYDDYNDDETDYEDDSKGNSGNEMGSGEDYYDDEEEENEEIKEGETINVSVKAKSQEGSMERPQIVTPRPGCIFAGRTENRQKRLLCPRRNSTDRPNTTADDQTNSEQTRRTITLLRASVQPVQQSYDTRGYNTTRYIQQQQPQQYTDPNYYSIYDEEAEQYKDIADYAQYIQQNKQDIYTRKKPSVEIVQQEPVQRGSGFQKNKYSTQPENIYQSVTPQEYDTYSIQNNDDLYRQVQTKSSTRFPEVKESGSTQGERRLITLSTKLSNSPLPTDIPTKTDRVGSGFRFENAQTEPNIVNITPRKRGQADTQMRPTTKADKSSGSLAQQVNALAPSSFILDPVGKVLDVLTKSGEYLSDEASVEESKEINHVTTDGSHRRKSPLTVEEINIDHLKNINFQSTPASRFKIATSPETPYVQPVIAMNNPSISQSFVQSSTKPSTTQAIPTVSSIPQAVEQNQQTRKTYEIPRRDNYSTEKNARVVSNREQPRQQIVKQDYSTRSRGTVRHHNSGEIMYSDPGSAQDYSDQSSSLEIPKRWRELPIMTKERDSKQWSTVQTTKDTEILEKQQPRFRPVTTSALQGLTTAIPPRNVESSTIPETITRTQQRLVENEQSIGVQYQPNQRTQQATPRNPVQLESTTQQLRIIGMRASFDSPTEKETDKTTDKQLLIRIPETFRLREETARKLEVPSIKVNTNQRAYTEREREIELSINNSDPTSEEARKPISIRIPDTSTRSRDSENTRDTVPSRKQYIKPRERGEGEYEKEKPVPIRFVDSLEFDSRSKARSSHRLRDSGRDTENNSESEQSRGQNLRSREYSNTVTASASSSEMQNLQPKISLQTDSRQRESLTVRSREHLNMELAKPVRVPNDQHQHTPTHEDEYTKADDTVRGPSRAEESAQRRGEQRGRGRQNDADKNSPITNRFEVATTLRPKYRLTSSSITSKTILSRPPKKFRNGTIYADQTLPIGTDMTDSPPSGEPDPSIRARPMSNNTPSTPGSTRNNVRHRGSQTYTVSPNEAEPAPSPVATSPPRGTPPPNRGRPTLKPSNSVVSKAAEFVDIYRYPPTRPENVYPTPQVDKTAAKCRKDVCLLPDCYCGGKEIPGELTPEETPQIVLLTFDDSVNDLNKGLYSDLFDKGRVNPNGCPISATFYVSHEWTDYSQVQNLYAGGHEIASHSVSHSFGEQFSQRKWTREIAGQREILAAYGGVKLEDIRGMRAPFLSVGGNKMFKMLYDSNFTYDSSMPVYENRPPSWPYTLDYKVFHDCMIPPCPTKSYPGVWEVPMVMWQDLNGGRCSMGDACSNPPTADGVYKMLIKNFERHFTTNRAPFGLFYHAAWFTQPHHKEGFISFLDTINKMPEVWLITNWQAIQWVRDPTPLSRLGSFAPFQCNYQDRPKKCNNPKVCNLWHKSGVRYMRTCQVCPDIYPWTGKSGVRNSRVENDLE